MHIGILQAGHAPAPVAARHGDYTDYFQSLLNGHDLTFTTWNVVDMEFPESPEAAEGWLITGSRHGAYEDHPFIPPLESFIRSVQSSGRPMIGICFGHQIIAQALGGKVEKFAGGWSIGRREYMTAKGPIALNAWHQDQVVQAPEGARTIASNDFCAHAGLVYGDTILTLQPHPEIRGDIMHDYLHKIGPDATRFPQDMVAQAQSDHGRPNTEAAIADQMAAFFRGEVPL